MSYRYKEPNPNSNNPGPGSYKYQQLNKEGKYGTSELRNSPLSKFPQAKRFKDLNMIIIKILGQGHSKRRI